MGIILSAYKKAILDDVVFTIAANVSHYYAFAANPIAFTGSVPALTYDDYTDQFTNDWQMMFGKLITTNNIVPVIENNIWTTNTIYTMYDNTSNSLFSNNNYYVVSPPNIVGAPYNIYKCINNANGSPSTVQPMAMQSTTFTTIDGYSWRYITSVSDEAYVQFSAGSFIPVFSNAIIQSSAATYSGVEVVMVTNAGAGYSTYFSGSIQGGNSSVIQIDAAASSLNNFYTNNGIYVFQNSSSIGQIRTITNYVSNTTGNWVYVNTPLSNVSIGTVSYNYNISPQVNFVTDGTVDPIAYSVVNTSTNSIASIVILNNGANISWANVSIISNSAYVSTPASVYAIVPPPGGHGSNPEMELLVQGFAMSISFANSESNTIPTNIGYNKIGIIKNPYSLNANNTQGSSYVSNTFNQMLVGNTTISFAVGSSVIGSNSGSLGTVAFSNTTTIYLTGDKSFQNNEVIYSANNPTQNCALTIVNLGNLYTKNINPLYITNISNINRSNTQSESYKLIVQI